MLSLIGAIIVGIIVLVLLFKPFFGSFDGFWECIKFWLTPDVISFFRGEHHEDRWAEMKLAIWLLGGGLAGYGTYVGIEKLMG